MGRRREDGAPAVGFRVVGGGGFDSGRVTAQSRSGRCCRVRGEVERLEGTKDGGVTAEDGRCRG